MKVPLFEVGDVVYHKSDFPYKVVILKVRKRLFNWCQTYVVNWYKGGEFHTGNAFEHELTKELKSQR